MLNETSFNISSQCIVQENYSYKIPTSFDKHFEQISVHSRIEATKFEPETTFENNIDEIKADNVKIITSLYINLSAIASKKPSLSYEHLNTDLMPWIVLQSPGNHYN